jgi:hypothetical protein
MPGAGEPARYRAYAPCPAERIVPLSRFLTDDTAFTPDDLAVIGAAFSQALAKLALNDRNDPIVETVARRIIRAALDGERDPTKLCQIATAGRASQGDAE